MTGKAVDRGMNESAILLAAGLRADWDSVERLRDAAPWYWAIGDCVRAGQVVNATEQGHNVVLDL